MQNRIVINGKTYGEKHMKAENISMGNVQSGGTDIKIMWRGA